jgi:two-component system, NtrC family, nitrogen regulation response regulator GlnG
MSGQLTWIVDDDRSIRWVLEKALEREGIAFRSFATATEAISHLESHPPAVIVSDIRMPGSSGLELLAAAKLNDATVPIIIMTAYSDLESTVAAFQGGAFDYLAKPFDIDHAVALIRRALATRVTARRSEARDSEGETEPSRNAKSTSPTPTPAEDANGGMLGQSPAMQEVFRAIGRLSNTQVSVLITGESGTGKELVARALHDHSPRKREPFIAINAAAIPRDLLESELFGHERGAFTGAQAQRRGRFEQAQGGTLFLDEIGDMPTELQTRLLRVLQEGEFYRVGGHTPIKADVRVIAATHQDLEARVRSNEFREDLYHRLNVVRIKLPALRERKEDIALLTQHFLKRVAAQLNAKPKRLTPAALRALSEFRFPGNVRQLENFCHSISVMSPGPIADVADLPAEVRTPLPREQTTSPTDSAYTWTADLDTALFAALEANEFAAGDRFTDEFERQMILTALRFTRGRRVEAAGWLGWGRNTITRKIYELQLEEELRRRGW